MQAMLSPLTCTNTDAAEYLPRRVYVDFHDLRARIHVVNIFRTRGDYDPLNVAIGAAMMILTGTVGAFLLAAWWLGYPA